MREDLTGKTFGYLTVIKFHGNNIKNKKPMWECKCKCGSNKTIIASTSDLKSGNTNSCGCYRLEQLQKISHKKFNVYDISGEYGIGYTQKGYRFLFDLDDYEKIKQYCWHKSCGGYLASYIDKKYIFMHDLIMQPDKGFYIDHIYHKNNDNRKQFLRYATRSQNAMNVGVRKNNTSGFTGVYFNKRSKKWNAEIKTNQRCIWLGSFANIENAIIARKDAEHIYFKGYYYKGESNEQ